MRFFLNASEALLENQHFLYPALLTAFKSRGSVALLFPLAVLAPLAGLLRREYALAFTVPSVIWGVGGLRRTSTYDGNLWSSAVVLQ